MIIIWILFNPKAQADRQRDLCAGEFDFKKEEEIRLDSDSSENHLHSTSQKKTSTKTQLDHQTSNSLDQTATIIRVHPIHHSCMKPVYPLYVSAAITEKN